MTIPKPSLRSSTSILHRAKELRKNLTPTEAILWERLCNRQLGGYKFHRQQPIGGYIADFYCAEARLVIEIDGEVHAIQNEADRLRTQQLTERGDRIIRFTKEEVEKRIETVLENIRTACEPDALFSCEREKREG